MLSTPPTTDAERLQWLVDRAEIHDLLVEYARTVDDRDFQGWQDLYASDGRFILPFGAVSKERLAEYAAAVLRPYPHTHHLQGNRAINIDGDRANVRCYLVSRHVVEGEDSSRHADVGGWFNITCRREDGRWRLVEVRAAFVWLSGEDFVPPEGFDMDPLPDDVRV